MRLYGRCVCVTAAAIAPPEGSPYTNRSTIIRNRIWYPYPWSFSRKYIYHGINQRICRAIKIKPAMVATFSIWNWFFVGLTVETHQVYAIWCHRLLCVCHWYSNKIFSHIVCNSLLGGNYFRMHSKIENIRLCAKYKTQSQPVPNMLQQSNRISVNVNQWHTHTNYL